MSFNKKLKFAKIKIEETLNRQKQTQFNSRFTVPSNDDKIYRYNALQDPHVGYYFANPSVKRHLKSIKRAYIKQQIHSKQKQKLKKLFSQKIKLPKANQTKANIYTIEQILANDSLRKASIRSMNSNRTHSIQMDSIRGETKRSFRYNNRKFSNLIKKNNSTVQAQIKQLSAKAKGATINNAQDQNTQNTKNQVFIMRQNIQISIEKKNDFKQNPNINANNAQRRKKKDSLKRKYESLNHESFVKFIQQKKNKLKQHQQSLAAQNLK